MRLLLDTHLFLWSMTADRRFKKQIRAEIERADVYISAASLWEISIKAALGKLHGEEHMTLLTVDENLPTYGSFVRLVR